MFLYSNSILQGSAKTVLVVISLLGFISFDVVYVAAVMNYAAQSEMNIKLIYAIISLIKQKRHQELDAAIKVNQSLQTAHATHKRLLYIAKYHILGKFHL